jgi:phage shock protein PspC (stress-responsive transcriptional regulator)
MNKVITINLGGNAYQLEEGGYDALRAYLEIAAATLAGNPDRDEILSDIEQAIAEKLRALLTSYKTVVESKEITAVLEEMGPINADSDEAPEPGATGAGAPSGTKEPGKAEEKQAGGSFGPPRRLYRIQEGAMIGGVCNGIGAYFNIDPTFVRLAFALSVIFFGSGVLVYIILMIVIPEAHSPEEKAAASGASPTAQEFIRRAKEGYYKAMKNFPDRNARREWQRRFKREMRANAAQWRHQWRGGWGQPSPFGPFGPFGPSGPFGPGMGFSLPMFSLLHGAATILLICALISLVNTGAIFGLELPDNMPVWGAALLLFFAYGILTWPLKMARRACYWGMARTKSCWPFMFLVEAVVWIAVVAALFWLGAHYFPELRHAIHRIPEITLQAANDIRTWWKGQ